MFNHLMIDNGKKGLCCGSLKRNLHGNFNPVDYPNLL